MAEDVSVELKRLCMDYQVSIRLDQHRTLSDISAKICNLLVKLLEDHVQRDADFEADSTRTLEKFKPLIDFIDAICGRLRRAGQVTAVYGDVVEFLQIRDLASLSQMVGAIRADDNSKRNRSTVDFDGLARILRQSTYLLGIVSARGDKSNRTPRRDKAEIEISRTNITSWTGIGFTKYTIALEALATGGGKLEEVDDDNADLNFDHQQSLGIELTRVLASSWFGQFRADALERPYPIDRFSLLVAIWIVASECEHRDAEQLVSGLVDEIYHQEANGCGEEDLMQLTQVGSIWLTQYKRHRATIRSPIGYLEEFEDLSGDDASDSSSASSAGDKVDKRSTSKLAPDFRVRLRQLIDDELLIGGQCLICDYQPSEPLERVNSADLCAGCSNGPTRYCSLSYRRLELLSLDAVLSRFEQIDELIVVSEGEWLSSMLAAAASRQQQQQQQQVERVVERVDISEKFERLTMLRGPIEGTGVDEFQQQDDEEKDDDGDGDEMDGDDEDGAESAIQLDVSARRDELCARLLREFMSLRLAGAVKLPEASESLMMLKFQLLETSNGSTSIILLCESDIFVMDHSNDSIDGSMNLRLVAAPSINSAGKLWLCSARSKLIGRLLLGCGRWFTSLELLRSGLLGSLEGRACPFCGHQLAEARRLAELV